MRIRRQLLLVLLALSALATGGSATLLARSRPNLPPPAFETAAASPSLHVYGNPSVSLERVDIRVVYFIPAGNGEEASADDSFRKTKAYLNAVVLPDITTFHAREFSGRSRISWRVYPRPVRGLRDDAFYNKKFLDVSAVLPLSAVEAELAARLFRPDGDLYDADYAVSQKDAYHILLVVYAEPVPLLRLAGQAVFIPGLTNEVGTAALVFRPVVDPQFRAVWPNGGTVLYHELMHTMGVPEQYDLSSIHVLEQQQKRGDVMGHGTQSPLLTTFVGGDIKRGMGLER